MQDDGSGAVNVRIERDIYEDLRPFADMERRTMTNMVNWVLAQYAKEKGEKLHGPTEDN